jgi:NADPH:quinone reductase-like Zn-dependent oxidoreductase
MPRASFITMLERSVGVMSTHLGILLDRAPELVRGMWEELVAFTLRHGIRPVVGAQFAFEEMARAHAHLESRGSVGKVVVTIPRTGTRTPPTRGEGST